MNLETVGCGVTGGETFDGIIHPSLSPSVLIADYIEHEVSTTGDCSKVGNSYGLVDLHTGLDADGDTLIRSIWAEGVNKIVKGSGGYRLFRCVLRQVRHADP